MRSEMAVICYNRNMEYTGTIILESLVNPKILTDFKIISSRKTENLGWHLYTVEISEEDINKLSQEINGVSWYMHFWNGNSIIAVYKNKIFKFEYDNKDSWIPAVNYGLSLGIPKEQLDFLIE